MRRSSAAPDQSRPSGVAAAPDPVHAALTDASRRVAEQGAQMTARRAQVYECLLRRDGVAKAYDLLTDIQTLEKAVAPMTVYRALDFLVEQGLVHKVAANASYVVCQHEGPHDHRDTVFLVCESCGQTTEWRDAQLGRRLALALGASGFHSHDVEIKGECAKCRAAADAH